MEIKANENLLRATAIIVGLSMSSVAHSALVTQDWMTAGDGYIVLDTNTNLEWLNLTQSSGLSYAYVSTQFGSGGQFDGMRYATNDEVIALWSTYFSIDLSSDAYPLSPEVPGYIDPNVRLASETLGTGISGGTDPVSGPNANYSLLGITADVRMDNGDQFILGARTGWSDTLYYTAIDPWYPPAAGWPEPTPSIATGSYLVRTSVIPVPGAAWLFGSGILALVSIVRRKQTPGNPS